MTFNKDVWLTEFMRGALDLSKPAWNANDTTLPRQALWKGVPHVIIALCGCKMTGEKGTRVKFIVSLNVERTAPTPVSELSTSTMNC